MGFIGEVRLGIIMIFWRGEGSRRAGAGLRFAEEWAAEEILDQVGSLLAAGRGLLQGMMSTAAAGAKLVVAFGVAGPSTKA